MFARQCQKYNAVRIPIREFSKRRPPKGFEKFYKKRNFEERKKPEENEESSRFNFSSEKWSKKLHNFVLTYRKPIYLTLGCSLGFY